MNKAYTRRTWHNYPNTTTPLNETNLNAVDLAVDTIDDRVITLDTTKADEADLLTCVSGISYNTSTGIMTITLKNGTTGTIDTGLSKLAVNFDYDDDPTSQHYQQLILELADGTYKYIDLSALITQFEFTDTSTIAWTIGQNGVISASVVDGSITANKLQPNYLADIIVEVGKAQAASSSASTSALVSEGYAKGTQNGTPVTSGSPYYENNAEYFKNQAQQIAGASIGGLSDVNITNLRNGQKLKSDVQGNFVNVDDVLSGLNDVNISGITDGQALGYDAATQKIVGMDVATTEDIFNLFYSLKNAVTTFPSNGDVVETFYSDDTLATSIAVATTAFPDNTHINTTIVPASGSYNYVKSTVFNIDGSITETYSAVSKGA